MFLLQTTALPSFIQLPRGNEPPTQRILPPADLQVFPTPEHSRLGMRWPGKFSVSYHGRQQPHILYARTTGELIIIGDQQSQPIRFLDRRTRVTNGRLKQQKLSPSDVRDLLKTPARVTGNDDRHRKAEGWRGWDELDLCGGVLVGDFSATDTTGLVLCHMKKWRRETGPEFADVSRASFSRSQMVDIMVRELFRLAAPAFQTEENIPQMNGHALIAAPYLGLSEGVRLFESLPNDDRPAIIEFRDLAMELAIILNGNQELTVEQRMRTGVDKDHPIRNVLHNRADPRLIRETIASCKVTAHKHQDKDELLRRLDRVQELCKTIYEKPYDTAQARSSLSPAMRDWIDWPPANQITNLEDLRAMAISLRQAFEAWDGNVNFAAQDRLALMRLAVEVNHSAIGLCRVVASDDNATQLRKIASLLTVMYGCGFGDRGLLALASRLDHLATKSSTMTDDVKPLQTEYLLLARSVLGDAQQSYHDLIEPRAKRLARKWNIGNEWWINIASNAYRMGCLIELDHQLNNLEIMPGQEAAAFRDVLHVLDSEDTITTANTLVVIDASDQSLQLIDVGGKAYHLADLHSLKDEIGFEIAPAVVIPRSMASTSTADELADLAKKIGDHLEGVTGKSFDEGSLKLAVRSSPVISMPGMAGTILDVSDRQQLITAISAVAESSNGERAQDYRSTQGIPSELASLGIIVQQMVDTTGDGLNNGFGLAQSNQENVPRIIFRKGAKGSELVAGREAGSQDSPPEEVAAKIRRLISALEKKYRAPVEIEFGVAKDGRLYVFQARKAHLAYKDLMAWAYKTILTGVITDDEAVALLGGRKRLLRALHSLRIDPHSSPTPVARGSHGHGPAIHGQIVVDPHQMNKFTHPILIVTDPDAISSATSAMRASAVLMVQGNGLSHLEGILRTLNIPSIGNLTITVNDDGYEATVTIATPDDLTSVTLAQGALVTLSPDTHALFEGHLPLVADDVGNLAQIILDSWQPV